MRVLVVDDDAVFRQELADLLEQDGHQTTAAESSAKALEALAAGHYDVVFTDLKMPRHSGMELLEEARRRWPRLLIVMITGFATVDTAVEAMKLGAFDYLRKPFQPAHLRRILSLAAEELRFQGPARPPGTIAEIARSWLAEGLSVLCVSDAPVRSLAHLTTVPVPQEARLVRDAVESFLPEHPRPGVILAGVDGLFEGDRPGDFLGFVTALERRLKGVGRLVVTFDPRRFSVAQVEELRACLAGPLTKSTLEALSNPIRRSVLERANQGPVTFSQALEAAGLDESPKLAFHLRRLLDEGLVGRQEDSYRITQRGIEAVRLLARWDTATSDGITTSAALPLSPA